jgi:hypothetical protein
MATNARETDARELLDELVGCWLLTGQMGQTPLRQAVGARWVLGGRFVEVSCRSVLPVSEGQEPYEALYHIGYNAEHDRFVMHLLDTFGVALSGTMGIGQRVGDSIPFTFVDPDGDRFVNTFTWHPEAGAWTHELMDYIGGGARLFATKHLTPVPDGPAS